jgi:predicted small secreted protein
MKKILSIIVVILIISTLFIGCTNTTTGSEADTKKQQAAANTLQNNQPTPTDIDYSLERYNLTRRAYWVNGQREKANSLPCAVTKPLSYIVLFADNGAVVGKFVVDGKVSSLNSYLTPDSEYYEYSGSSSSYKNDWLADVDGTYGTNDNGIFFFTPEGRYIEWTGTYFYTDAYVEIDNPIIYIQEGNVNG